MNCPCKHGRIDDVGEWEWECAILERVWGEKTPCCYEWRTTGDANEDGSGCAYYVLQADIDLLAARQIPEGLVVRECGALTDVADTTGRDCPRCLGVRYYLLSESDAAEIDAAKAAREEPDAKL